MSLSKKIASKDRRTLIHVKLRHEGAVVFTCHKANMYDDPPIIGVGFSLDDTVALANALIRGMTMTQIFMLEDLWPNDESSTGRWLSRWTC